MIVISKNDFYTNNICRNAFLTNLQEKFELELNFCESIEFQKKMPFHDFRKLPNLFYGMTFPFTNEPPHWKTNNLQMQKNKDGRATFVRVSRTCRREILANLPCEIFTTLLRMSCECHTTVMRQSCENLATIWRENKTKRYSYECRATLARMLPDCHTN